MRKISIALTAAVIAGAVAWHKTALAVPAKEGAQASEAAVPLADGPRMYGLVIGIDHYQLPAPELGGAVNDAKIVAGALRSIGAQVTEVMDEEATRDNIKRAWDGIVGKAKAGDIVVFSYAGHGDQSPERVQGSEDDGMDEYFVLRNFTPDQPGNYERIMDDDLQEWFSQAPQLKIVLVADSCHSGTMTRAYQQPKLRYRYARLPPIINDTLPPPNPAKVDRGARVMAITGALPTFSPESAARLPHVVSLSAVSDAELDPEVNIEGIAHGALSWYFAQGIMGEADADLDGEITAGEMKDYLYENVKNMTEGQQHPQFGNTEAWPSPKAKPGKPKLLPEPKAISFAFSGNADNAEVETYAKAQLKHVEWADAKAARLEWNLRENVIRNPFGDVVYRLVEPAADAPKTKAFVRVEARADARAQDRVAQAQAVVDKFAAVDALAALADGGVGVSLKPGDKLHRNGEELTLIAERMKYPYFTLFNLASDGSVNFLYPSLPSDTPQLPPGQPYPLALAVAPPFGADHFVAISSSAELKNLHQALKQANGQRPDWAKLLGEIRDSLKGVDYQVGLQSTFTSD